MDDTVTVTPTAANGYTLTTITWNDGTAHDITVEKKFTMPAANVTVSAVFTTPAKSITITDLPGEATEMGLTAKVTLYSTRSTAGQAIASTGTVSVTSTTISGALYTGSAAPWEGTGDYYARIEVQVPAMGNATMFDLLSYAPLEYYGNPSESIPYGAFGPADPNGRVLKISGLEPDFDWAAVICMPGEPLSLETDSLVTATGWRSSSGDTYFSLIVLSDNQFPAIWTGSGSRDIYLQKSLPGIDEESGMLLRFYTKAAVEFNEYYTDLSMGDFTDFGESGQGQKVTISGLDSYDGKYYQIYSYISDSSLGLSGFGIISGGAVTEYLFTSSSEPPYVISPWKPASGSGSVILQMNDDLPDSPEASPDHTFYTTSPVTFGSDIELNLGDDFTKSQ
jgi:hypothetical protein